jgi:hypothetical protein
MLAEVVGKNALMCASGENAKTVLGNGFFNVLRRSFQVTITVTFYHTHSPVNLRRRACSGEPDSSTGECVATFTRIKRAAPNCKISHSVFFWKALAVKKMSLLEMCCTRQS